LLSTALANGWIAIVQWGIILHVGQPLTLTAIAFGLIPTASTCKSNHLPIGYSSFNVSTFLILLVAVVVLVVVVTYEADVVVWVIVSAVFVILDDEVVSTIDKLDNWLVRFISDSSGNQYFGL